MNDDLLQLEYQYAHDTALQAQQDRLTLLNLFLAIYTAVMAFALGGGSEIIGNNEAIKVSPFVMSIIGVIFVLQIARLRQAWIESLHAMTKVKEFYLNRDAKIGDHLLWNLMTIPKPNRLNTISFFSALLIAILSALALSAGILLLNGTVAAAAVSGVIYLLVMVILYQVLLKFGR